MQCHFLRKKDHTADGEGAQREFESLLGLSTADLAAELMPAFSPDGPHHGKDVHGLQLVSWLMRQYRGAGNVSRPAEKLYAAVQEALQVLEHAELIRAKQSGDRSVHWSATRLGVQALADGDVIKRIEERAGG